ncbi:MAG TPA: hypothetical protein VJH55_01480 [Candidatus Paceibacterota bacterium]
MLFQSWFEGNKVWKNFDEHWRPGKIIKLHRQSERFDVQYDDGGIEENADPAEFTKKPPVIPLAQ